jgi:hypothetical protein
MFFPEPIDWDTEIACFNPGVIEDGQEAVDVAKIPSKMLPGECLCLILREAMGG